MNQLVGLREGGVTRKWVGVINIAKLLKTAQKCEKNNAEKSKIFKTSKNDQRNFVFFQGGTAAAAAAGAKIGLKNLNYA